MQQTLEAVDISTNELTDSSYTGKVPSWIRDARKVIRQSDTNFFKVSPLRYWTDFIFSLVCAYSAAMIYLLFPLGSWQQLVAFPIAVFWLYRLGSLIHEVCHLGAELPHPLLHCIGLLFWLCDALNGSRLYWYTRLGQDMKGEHIA